MSLVGVEDRGGVRQLVLRRAEKRNALNGELIQALGAAIEDAAADDAVRVVVLRGDGPMFSSGMDVGDLRALSERPESLRRYRRPILQWWNLMEECRSRASARSMARRSAARSSWPWRATSERWPRTP